MYKMCGALLFSVVSLNSQATSFDYRHEYRPGDDLDYDRFKVSQSFDNNLFLGVEARWLSYGSDSNALNNMVSNGHEVELGYVYKLNDKWTLTPSVSIDSASSANSTTYKYHLKGTYKINDNFYVASRFRYGQVLNQTKDDTNYQQYDFYAGYKNGPLAVEYDFGFTDTNYPSYKNTHRNYDHNLFVGYAVNSKWTPYVEVGYIPYKPSGEVYGSKWEPRYRIGLKYTL